MKSTVLALSALFVCLTLPAMGQPTIDKLQNNYSYLLPGNANYGIARGSIFIVIGSNLANTSTGLQSSTEAPYLQTTLEGVSAKVTVNGITTDVIWYYVTPSYLGGILPSNTPAGNGTIVVNNNGTMSAPAPIKVVDSAFGVLTLDGSGTGAAAVYDLGYQFLTSTNSAKPGEIIQLFGSGLGMVTEPENMQQPAKDMMHIPVVVRIGGMSANVGFRGRIFPGLDQLNVEVPMLATAELGCNVAVEVQIGNYGSNMTTIPVSADVGACPAPPNNGGGGGGSTSDLNISQAEINQWLAAGQYRTGSVSLTRETSYAITDDVLNGGTATTVTKSDVLSAGFSRITGSDLGKMFDPSLTGIFAPTAGQCAVITGIPANPLPNLLYTSLDAGASVSAMGPSGTRSAPKMAQMNTITYNATMGAGMGSDFLAPGSYTLSGPGGADVGSFSGSLNIAPELVWTNRVNLGVVDRSQPLLVTWSGGEPSTLVTVQGSSFATNGDAVTSSTFTCWANNSAGQLTVPVSVLGQLPASSRIDAGPISLVQRGSLAVGSTGTGLRMFASGVDYLTGGNQWGIAQSTEYK